LILKRHEGIEQFGFPACADVCAIRIVAEVILMADPLIPSKRHVCSVFVTVFWGGWHRGTFLNANLPTMLAPGNLPALAVGVDCEYLIYTTAKDAAELEGDLAFAR
jgi:hypothetical protein